MLFMLDMLTGEGEGLGRAWEWLGQVLRKAASEHQLLLPKNLHSAMGKGRTNTKRADWHRMAASETGGGARGCQ